MIDLDPAWLRSFAAIARTGSVTRAAQAVNRTQSAVARSSSSSRRRWACASSSAVPARSR